MSKDRDQKLPMLDLDCPKCGNDKAYGPEFRRGHDDGLGEHLRRYCTNCRYMTVVPTRDQDTPERRAELNRAFTSRMTRSRPVSSVSNFVAEEVQEKRAAVSRPRSWGWKD